MSVKNKKDILSAGSLLVLLLLVIMLGLQLNHVFFLSRQKREQYHKAVLYLNNLPYYKKKTAEMKEEYDRAPKKILKGADALSLLNQCLAIAKNVNININGYKPGEIVDHSMEQYREIKIELDIRSDYTGLMNFIRQLEKKSFISRIDEIDIQRQSLNSAEIRTRILITGFSLL